MLVFGKVGGYCCYGDQGMVLNVIKERKIKIGMCQVFRNLLKKQFLFIQCGFLDLDKFCSL